MNVKILVIVIFFILSIPVSAQNYSRTTNKNNFETRNLFINKNMRNRNNLKRSNLFRNEMRLRDTTLDCVRQRRHHRYHQGIRYHRIQRFPVRRFHQRSTDLTICTCDFPRRRSCSKFHHKHYKNYYHRRFHNHRNHMNRGNKQRMRY